MTSQLAIEYVPIGDVQPHPDNARLHLTAHLVAESIDAHGVYKPLVVQRSTGAILAGNGLWQVLKDRGEGEVAVTYVDVDDEQATRILLVDNATSDESTYDEQALADLLTALEGDFAGTGWTEQAAGDLLDLLGATLEPGELEEKYGDDPDPSHFWPVARIQLPNDIYEVWIKLVAQHDGIPHRALRFLLHDAGLLE